MPRIPFWSYVMMLVVMVSNWFVYKKMGRHGWESLIPFYNTYVLCDLLYGNGMRVLLMLVPLYNIFFYIRLRMDLAKTFNKEQGFGFGLAFVPVVFYPMLAFGNATYGDGSYENKEEDFVTNAVTKMKGFAQDSGLKMPKAMSPEEKQRRDSMATLEELGTLRDHGILTEEEYQAKKADLLQQVQ